MDLLLVRHAAAEDRDPERWPDDSRRPLTRSGRRRFRALLGALQGALPRPEVVLASRYDRAWDTALELADALDTPAPTACEALEEQGLGAMLASLREQTCERVAMVGHEPWIGAFASLLVWGPGVEQATRMQPTIKVRKGAVLLLGVDAPARPGTATMRLLVDPKSVPQPE